MKFNVYCKNFRYIQNIFNLAFSLVLNKDGYKVNLKKQRLTKLSRIKAI